MLGCPARDGAPALPLCREKVWLSAGALPEGNAAESTGVAKGSEGPPPSSWTDALTKIPEASCGEPSHICISAHESPAAATSWTTLSVRLRSSIELYVAVARVTASFAGGAEVEVVGHNGASPRGEKDPPVMVSC